MLRPNYPLKTARLLLRPYISDDLDALHAMSSRPEVTRYLYTEPTDLAGTRERLRAKMEAAQIQDEGDRLVLAVMSQETGAVIGDVMLRWSSREHQQGEVGYMFHPDHGGKGYATEAAAEMLRLGFEELGLHRIFGRLDARNTPSARVLERLGMRREAHMLENEFFKGEWSDEFVYGILRREWLASR